MPEHFTPTSIAGTMMQAEPEQYHDIAKGAAWEVYQDMLRDALAQSGLFASTEELKAFTDVNDADIGSAGNEKVYQEELAASGISPERAAALLADSRFQHFIDANVLFFALSAAEELPLIDAAARRLEAMLVKQHHVDRATLETALGDRFLHDRTQYEKAEARRRTPPMR